MMKVSIAKSIFALMLFAPSLVLAQNQAVLPNAGFTPESPFYFLDKFGETLREFFTFNPEGKARLQIIFAAERIAEIKVILETKGVRAKGLDIAQSRLLANIARAATLIEGEKQKGEDVSALAKSISDELDVKKEALEQTFKEQKRTLKVQEDELKTKIREARRVGDTAQIEALLKQLAEVKTQKELLELKEEEQEEALEREGERLEKELEAKEEAEKAIRKAEEEKQEVLGEASEEEIAVPAEAFEKFDRLLTQAKELFARGNYQGAKQLAKQAEKGLDTVEEAIEELEEAKEKEEELKEEQEEKEREAKEEQEEQTREETEREAERLEREREKAEGEARQAEDRLRKAGDDED